MEHLPKAILAVSLALLAGCATPRWTVVGGEYRDESKNVLVDLPKGWVKSGSGDSIFLTREGGALQAIIISRHEIGENLPSTKKKFQKGMLPQEVAEVALDQFHSNPAFERMTVLENRPETIGGYAGFRSVFTYRSKNGVRYKIIFCGFLLENHFYFIRYSAAQRHYFDRDAETFEKVLHSFRLIKAPERPMEKKAAGA